jgi:hypothetical protein
MPDDRHADVAGVAAATFEPAPSSGATLTAGSADAGLSQALSDGLDAVNLGRSVRDRATVGA